MTALLSLLQSQGLSIAPSSSSSLSLQPFVSWSILCSCTLLLYLVMLKNTILVVGTSFSNLSLSFWALFLSQP